MELIEAIRRARAELGEVTVKGAENLQHLFTAMILLEKMENVIEHPTTTKEGD